MKKVLFDKKWKCVDAYGIDEERFIFYPYLKVEMNFTLKKGLWFSASTMNFTTSGRNLVKVLYRSIERNTVGYAKYQRLKEEARNKNVWEKLG